MARTCTICAHPKRSEIELSVTNGTAYRDIALQYAVGAMSISRHMNEHIKQAAKQLQEQREEAKALDVITQLKTINKVCWAIVKEARDSGKDGRALFAIDRIQKQLELSAKLLGDLDERPVVNVWLLPEWIRIQTCMLQTLLDYPEARIAVAAAVAALEEENT